MPDRTSIDRMIRLEKIGDRLTLSVDVGPTLPLGLVIHAGARDTSLRMMMKCAGAEVVKPGRECRQPGSMQSKKEKNA